MSQRQREERQICFLIDLCVQDGLAMPVVDLLDVAKDDLVFASHVLWNPSDFQPGHEALRNTHGPNLIQLVFK